MKVPRKMEKRKMKTVVTMIMRMMRTTTMKKRKKVKVRKQSANIVARQHASGRNTKTSSSFSLTCRMASD